MTPDEALAVGFRPSTGWVNDPHGVTYHDGRYHLFFQHVPGSDEWQPEVVWGHATSPDLRTWTEHDPVLVPEPPEVGCWSGCLADGTIFYTSAGKDLELGTVRAATPLDASWSRWRRTPLAIAAPPGLSAFRDPQVVRDGDGWRMAVGGRSADGPVVVSFVSENLQAWSYDGVLVAGRAPEDGHTWECPQLVDLGGDWALVVSRQLDGRGLDIAYALGTLVDGRFEAGPWRPLVTGSPYAGTVLHDEQRRNVMMFWLRAERAISAPYVLARHGDELALSPMSGAGPGGPA